MQPAMCAEPRNGSLYIFMPPTDKLEEYLELAAAVEATAEAMDTPVILEGYEPPKDPRLIEGWLRSKAGIEDPQELRARRFQIRAQVGHSKVQHREIHRVEHARQRNDREANPLTTRCF